MHKTPKNRKRNEFESKKKFQKKIFFWKGKKGTFLPPLAQSVFIRATTEPCSNAKVASIGKNTAVSTVKVARAFPSNTVKSVHGNDP